jgi:hypothetical protein
MDDSNKSGVRVILAIAALSAFAFATVWINYQVKVNVQGGGGHGAVHEMGNVKIGDPAPGFSAMDLSNRLVSLPDFRAKKLCFPNLVLIGKDGVIRWLQVGYTANDNDLEKQIENLTAK